MRGPTEGKVLWRAKLEGAVTPGPAVGKNGVIYAASNGGVLHALDADGNELWSFDGGSPYGNDLSTTPAITRGGEILWPGPAGTLYALSEDGELRWKREFGSFVLSPALGPNGVIYVMEMGGTLHALRPRSGGNAVEELWSLPLDGTSYGSPALGPNGSIYTAAGNDLVAVSAKGAEPRVEWRFTTDDIVEVSPAVGPDGTVVIGSNDRHEYGVSPQGKERWSFDLTDLPYSSPAVSDDGIAYIGAHTGAVTAVRSNSGKPVGLYQGQPKTDELRSVGVWTAPLIDARHNVYFGTRLGHIYGFSFDGEQLFDVNTGETVDSYPALSADGTLLIGSSNGYLYAIG